jgi:AraC-like DNA-binding protein
MPEPCSTNSWREAATYRVVPAFLFGPFWAELERRGVPIAELERVSGLSRPVVGRYAGTMTSDDALRLYDAAVHLTGDVTLGLQVASQLHIASLHLLGHVIMASCTLRQALTLAEALDPRGYRVFTEVLDSGRVRVGQRCAPLTTVAEQIHAQLAAVYIAKLVSYFCPMVSDQLVASLPFPAPADVQPYLVSFPAGVRFDADGIFVTLAESALDHQRPDADPLLAEHLRVFAKDLYATEGNAEDWVARTCSVLRAQPAPRAITKGELAKRLGLSSSGLARRLAAQGATIAQLVDRVLYERADRLLTRSQASYAEIADALGYAEVTSFFRAFRRWSGSSPQSHRQRSQCPEG